MSTAIVIGDETIDLSERGLVQIKRLSSLGKFLKDYGNLAIKQSDFSGVQEGNSAGILQFVLDFVGSIDESGLVLLGQIVSGKDETFVKENFDLEWVVDGIVILINMPAFRKIVDRFFGRPE